MLPEGWHDVGKGIDKIKREISTGAVDLELEMVRRGGFSRLRPVG